MFIGLSWEFVHICISRCFLFVSTHFVSINSENKYLLSFFANQVLMKPGKPLTFAEILPGSSDRTSSKILAFGLPGNPVSCLVCFHLFVVPAIKHLSGWANPHLPRLQRVDKRSPLLSLSLNPFPIQFLGDL